jgi:hypothetical protein
VLTIATPVGSVRVQWFVREELLGRLRPRADGAEVVRRFEAVGTSRPVALNDAGRDLLREVVEEWVAEVGEFGPPPAVAELRETLHEDATARGLDAA